MTNETPFENVRTINQEIDYSKIIRIFWSRWYLIAGSVIISVLIAYIYLWYTPKTYSTSASLKFEGKENEISELLKQQYSFGHENKLESESYVIQSMEVLTNAIKMIDYEVFFYLKGRLRTTEIYPTKAYDVQLLSMDSTINFNGPFTLTDFENYVNVVYSEGEKTIENKVAYGKKITIKGTSFIIQKPVVKNQSIYLMTFNRPENLIGRILRSLTIRETAKGSNVMALTMTDPNPVFAKDILNAILESYTKFDKKDRGQAASQTIDFITKQLIIMQEVVNNSQNDIKKFKEANKLFNVETSAQTKITKMDNLEDQIVQIKLQSLLFNQIEEQIKKNKNSVYINFNLEAIENGLLTDLVRQLNQSIRERNALSNQFNSNSDPIKEVDENINTIKDAIIRNIEQQRLRNNKILSYTNEQLNKTESQVKTLPEKEQLFLDFERTYFINEKVFTYLSEKKLEAQIARSAILPGASIVNKAELSYVAIFPNFTRIYTSSLLLGLTFGISLIVLMRLFNPYIYDKETVESLTTKPILGVIRKFPEKIDANNRNFLSFTKPKSIFSESVRSVRTNLSFLASEKNSKIICITSEIAGEGKSFITINLATTLALIDKKVIIIAADLRKSKLQKVFEVKADTGLSTYLSNQHTLEEIKHPTQIHNLDFIPAGPNPPNPSELLYKEKMKDLLEELSTTYDYILIDTAPVGLVSDSIPLIRLSDINIFVIRSGVSRQNSASIPERISHEYNLNNVVIILNAFGDDSLYTTIYTTNYSNNYYNNYYYSDYNGYYGSGYFEDDKPNWWHLIKRYKIWKNSNKS